MKQVSIQDILVGGCYCVYETNSYKDNLYMKLYYIKVTKLFNHVGFQCAIYRRGNIVIDNGRTDYMFLINAPNIKSWYYEMNDEEIGKLIMDII